MAGRSCWLCLLGVLALCSGVEGIHAEHEPGEPPIQVMFPVEGFPVVNPVVLTFRLSGLDRRFDPRELQCLIDGHDATLELQRSLIRHPDRLFAQDTDLVEVRFPVELSAGVHEIEYLWGPSGESSRNRILVEGERGSPRRFEPVHSLEGVDLSPPQLDWELESQPFVDRRFVPSSRPHLVVASREERSATSHWMLMVDHSVRLREPGAVGLSWEPVEELAPGKHVATVLAQDRHGNMTVDSREFMVFEPANRHLWPVGGEVEDQSLGHLAHNFQHYGGRPYFHPGVDVRAPAETPVYAATGGRVVALCYYGARPLYFEVAIEDDDGFLWEYHHIAEQSVPEAIRRAHEEGEPIAAGSQLGEVIHWRVHAYGSRYDHLHLNVLDPWGNYLNPLHFVKLPVRDEEAPRILGAYLCANEGDEAFPPVGSVGIPVVSGDVDIVLEAEDSFGFAPYQLGVYEISYQIFHLTRSSPRPMTEPILFCRFDTLPGGFDRHSGIDGVFKRRLKVGSEVLETEGNYSKRRFLYVLTHAPAGRAVGAESYWDTDGFHPDGSPRYPDGRYRLAVMARDISGNTARRSFDILVKNGSDAQSK